MRAVSGPKHEWGPQETTDIDKGLTYLVSPMFLARGLDEAAAGLKEVRHDESGSRTHPARHGGL
jgi:hypothetical protein